MEIMSEARQPRHASRRSPVFAVALPFGLAVTALGALWALADAPVPVEPVVPPMPAAAAELPAVDLDGVLAVDPCSEQTVVDALAAGDDEAVVAGFGGGAAFREAVIAGNAPCISLDDPVRTWVVVNKKRPLDPIDYVPEGMTGVSVRATTLSDQLRLDASDALAAMASDLDAAGAGTLGINNGYRSYNLQVRNYYGYVESDGQEGADASSARPGYSEHQIGLAMDVVSCSSGCGGIGAFAGTAEEAWVTEHAWEYGFIVRYEEGMTGTTGYIPEPWHLRYIGPQLAAAYHDGGFHTLEEFFGLEAAPDYAH